MTYLHAKWNVYIATSDMSTWGRVLPAGKVKSVPSILTALVNISLELEQLYHTL